MSNVSIPEEEYKESLSSQMLLDALIACGVDNWEWYEEAQQTVLDWHINGP